MLWHAGGNFGWMLIAAALLAGCGSGENLPPRAKVTGKVTLDGHILTTGSVTFVPDKSRNTAGPSAVGGIDGTGHYQLSTSRQSGDDGAVIGFHKVRIIANEIPKDPKVSMGASLIPLKYNNEATSEIEREVKAGVDNVIDLELSTKP